MCQSYKHSQEKAKNEEREESYQEQCIQLLKRYTPLRDGISQGRQREDINITTSVYMEGKTHH